MISTNQAGGVMPLLHLFPLTSPSALMTMIEGAFQRVLVDVMALEGKGRKHCTFATRLEMMSVVDRARVVESGRLMMVNLSLEWLLD